MKEQRHQRHAEGLAELMLDAAPAWTRPLVRHLCLGIHGFEGEEDRRVPLHDDDLARLAMFPNLESLDLTMTSVRDLSAITALKNLRHLVLDDTLVEDLSPLAALERLETLSVQGGQVRRLGPLGRLSRLRELDLRETYALKALEGLQGAASLRRIDLAMSDVSDISALAQVPALQELVLSHECADLAALRHLPCLHKLSGVNAASRLETLAGAAVQQLDGIIDRCQLKCLVALPQLSKVSITIEDTPAWQELRPLGRLKNLEELGLSFSCQARSRNCLANPHISKRVQCTRLPDLTFLAGLQRLRQLRICHARIDSLAGLASLAQLQELRLPYASLQDIGEISRLHQLRVLVLDGNPISDISPLRHLPRLQRLSLANTKAADLTPLRQIRGLQALRLSPDQGWLQEHTKIRQAINSAGATDTP